MRRFEIAGKVISDDSDCYVIAEIGNNHQGCVTTAKKMIRKAKICGASAAKFQKRDNKALYTSELYNQTYDNRNSFGPTYGAHREALEFDWKEYIELKGYAREIGIDFIVTAFDQNSAAFILELGVDAIKVASGDLDNLPLLRQVAGSGLPVILSTGGSSLDDVRRACGTILPLNPNLCVLQCTSGYPAAFGELNLRVIETFRREFPETVVGLSSHDYGVSMPVAAFALGARVVEKHFTLDKTLPGTDHVFSLEPNDLRAMVRDLRHVRQALGDGVKRLYESEKGPMLKMRKKLVAARNLSPGHVLRQEDMTLRSPGNGVPAFEHDCFLGRVVLAPLSEQDAITYENTAQAAG